MGFFTQTRGSKILGLIVVVLLSAFMAPVYGFVKASDANHIIDVNISCNVVEIKNPSGFTTGWRFSVTGSQVNGPTTQVKIHIPWSPYAVEGPGSGTSSSYTYDGSVPPSTWAASAETFQRPGWAGSLTECVFGVPQPSNDTPELSVLKSGPASASADTDIAYTVAVKNSGNATAHDVTISDVFDVQRLTFVSANSSTCQLRNSGVATVNCRLGELPAGQTKTIVFTFHVKLSAACSQISNRAEMTAAEPVSQPQSTVTTNIACPIPALVCTPASQTVNIGQNANVSATGGTGTYAWSAADGSPSSGTGSKFSTKYPVSGNKIIIVTSGGQTATCGVIVNTPTPTLVCVPVSQGVDINQFANVSASGGTGTYTWTATGGTPASGTGASFSTRYVTPGNKTVTVVSGTQTANCAVVVSVQVPQLVCAPATQTVLVDQAAAFSATGGNGSFSWSAVGGSPSTGSGSNFSTSYATAGSRSVVVTSGNQSATCAVNVNVRQTQLVCSPASQTVALGQQVTLTASGGNGSYAWSAPDASTSNINNQTITVAYNSTGTKTVTVSSAGMQASCLVTLNTITNNNTTLSITKLVRNVTQNGTFVENLNNVRVGDVLEYQIRVRNTGGASATSVMLRDFLSQQNLLASFRNLSASVGFNGTLGSGNAISFNSDLAPNQEIVVSYLYSATSQLNGNLSACNTATASASNAGSVTDTACVTGGTVGVPNLVLSKSARNDTKNADATTVPASREDYITYTLTVRNTGTTEAVNYVLTDSLSGVLPLADIVDFGGGTLNGQTLSYPAITIPAGGSVSKNFRVRVKYFLSSSISYQMINTFGNTVTIVINPPPPYTPPRTGGPLDILGGIGFAGLLTSVFVLHRKKNLTKLLFS